MNEITEFLRESNAIEGIFSEEALTDAEKAWKYAHKNRDDISLEWLLEIHRLLLRKLDPQIAGRVRDCDVYIGGRVCKFEGKLKLEWGILSVLQDMVLDRIIEQASDKEKEKYARAVHVAYEHLHPFADGNGRSGRILYNIHRLSLGLPIHIIKNAEKQSYYKWF